MTKEKATVTAMHTKICLTPVSTCHYSIIHIEAFIEYRLKGLCYILYVNLPAEIPILMINFGDKATHTEINQVLTLLYVYACAHR